MGFSRTLDLDSSLQDHDVNYSGRIYQLADILDLRVLDVTKMEPERQQGLCNEDFPQTADVKQGTSGAETLH